MSYLAGVGEFNKLWAGQTASLVGSALTLFALPTLAVLVLHATPLQVGTLAALETLPFPLLGMIVGVLADRMPRRTIMIAADVARFVVLGAVPLAALAHVLRIELLYAVALISGIASAFFGITYQSYLPVVVSKDRLTDANTRLEFSNSGSAMAGNALAGGLIQWIGAPAAIAVDAFSYLISVATLATIRAPEARHEGPPLSLRRLAHEMGEGLVLVLKSPDLRWISAATATTNLGSAMLNAVFFIYAYRTLHLQPGLLGAVYGIAQLGFVGALLSTRVRRALGFRVTLIVALLISAAGLAVMLLAQVAVPYVFLFVSEVIVAMSVPIYNVNQISYRQALVDVRMQGRLNATIRTIVWGTLPIGSVIGGYLGSVAGVRVTIAIAAVLCGAAPLWLLPMRERAISAPSFIAAEETEKALT